MKSTDGTGPEKSRVYLLEDCCHKGMSAIQDERQPSKPLVCGLFGPHPQAHRTKIVMCGARTRTPFIAPARAPAPAPAHFFKKIQKKFFWLKSSFFWIFLQK